MIHYVAESSGASGIVPEGVDFFTGKTMPETSEIDGTSQFLFDVLNGQFVDATFTRKDLVVAKASLDALLWVSGRGCAFTSTVGRLMKKVSDAGHVPVGEIEQKEYENSLREMFSRLPSDIQDKFKNSDLTAVEAVRLHGDRCVVRRSKLPVLSDRHCQQCGEIHSPGLPHTPTDRYKVIFGSVNGLLPSWEDCVSHCDEVLQGRFVVLLEQYKINVSEAARPLSGGVLIVARELLKSWTKRHV